MCGVVPDADAGVAPPVEALADVVAIAEADALFENGRAGTQDELDAPFHAVDAIDIADGDAERFRRRVSRTKNRRATSTSNCVKRES